MFWNSILWMTDVPGWRHARERRPCSVWRHDRQREPVQLLGDGYLTS